MNADPKRSRALIHALFLLFFLPSAFVHAQTRNSLVKGVVQTNENQVVPAVSVVIKNAKTNFTSGTSTDSSGVFTFSRIPSGGPYSFNFSAVGYESQTLSGYNIKDDITLSLLVKMKQTAASLDQVVVVGYGAQNRRNVTGAIAKVDMKSLENLPNTNVTQAIRGKVAGVQFIDNGRPGQSGSIVIRGNRSLTGLNDPLIILDGIQFNSALSDINPNDIESMEILKDASASAIYGSRAANGVILITSKKGKTDKPTIRVNAYYGKSDWSYKMKILSPERYVQALLDWRKQSGLAADPAQAANYLQPSEVENYRAGKTVDPWKAISQDASIGNYDVSVSGKAGATNYFLSGSISNEKGLIYNDNMKRVSLRANIENKIANWLTIGMNSTFSKRDFSGQEASISNAAKLSPFGTLYYPDGEPTRFPVPEEQVVQNPMRDAILTQNEEIYNNIFTNLYAVVAIPALKGLTYRLNYSPNFRWRHEYNFVRQDKYLTSNNTSASKFNQENFDWVLENILTYNHRFNENHALDLTLLYGENHTGLENTMARAAPLSNSTNGWNNLSFGEIQTTTSTAEATDGVSSMARLNYRLKEKYIATLTVRRDGSSVFAERNKYATFPSAGFAWIMSDEKFLARNKVINSLKLRLSYGAVGNQAIRAYQSLSSSSIAQYVYGDGGTTTTGVFPSNIANPDLKWETTTTANIGLDFQLLDSRLGGTIEAYDMKTSDLIMARSLPVMTGFNTILTNLGGTSNQGMELTLNSVNVKSKRFEWSTNIVFSTNRNKIVHLYNSDTNGDGKEDDDLGNRWFIGKPANVAFDYVMDGVYQAGDQLPTGYQPGFIRLKDLDGDKKITAADRTVIGQLDPKYRWGVTNTFRYGNLSLLVFVNAMQGWIRSFNTLDFTGSSLGNNFPGRAVNMLDADWWTADNKSATRPSLVYSNPTLHGYYLSRDFIRIQDVSLAYEVNKDFLRKLKIDAMRFYVSAKNLYTFTNWIGPDPESGNNGYSTFYPTPRTITAGINLGF